MLWLLESGLVAIARLLLYLRLLGQVTNLFPQLTRRLSAGEPHARVRGPCAQFGGMGLEHVQQLIDVARAASRGARDANVFNRGRLLRNAEQVAGEQSEKLRGAVPWLEDTDIPSDWDQANRFRMRATKAIHDHDMQPRTGLVDELERRLEQAERAEGEKPSPEQVKALALRMAEQRERAAEDPTQDMNRPEPSGDEPLDLSEPEDLGESGPFEERSAPRTKADLLREIRQRADRRTGQQEAEQRQIDPWQAQPPQRRGHGR